MDNNTPENKMMPQPISNKTNAFGARQFIISDRVVNKCVNLVGSLEGHDMQTEGIELLQAMQERPYAAD